MDPYDAWLSLLGGSRDNACALARPLRAGLSFSSPDVLPFSSSTSLSPPPVLCSPSLRRLLQLPRRPLRRLLQLPRRPPRRLLRLPADCSYDGVRRRLFVRLSYRRSPLLICTVARLFTSAHSSVWLSPDLFCLLQRLHPLRCFCTPL